MVKSVEEISRLQQGDILVCQVTNPTWAPIFQKIVGGGVRHRRLDEPRGDRGARVRVARGGRHRQRDLADQGRPAHPRRRRARHRDHPSNNAEIDGFHVGRTRSRNQTAPPSTAYKIVDVAENYKRRHRASRIAGNLRRVPRWRRARGCRSATRPRSGISRSTRGTTSTATSCGSRRPASSARTSIAAPSSMMCLEGSARYLEYDWVAHPGDFIYETPGLMHTLVSDHPEGVKLFGWLQGADRVLRRQGQLHRDARRVVVHQPLRVVLPRTRHPDQQATLYIVSDTGASSAGSPTSGSPTGPRSAARAAASASSRAPASRCRRDSWCARRRSSDFIEALEREAPAARAKSQALEPRRSRRRSRACSRAHARAHRSADAARRRAR